MGGVVTDEHGRASVPGLYAAGETAGGVNGANRVDSNAIPETQVFGARGYLCRRAHPAEAARAPRERPRQVVIDQARVLLAGSFRWRGGQLARGKATVGQRPLKNRLSPSIASKSPQRVKHRRPSLLTKRPPLRIVQRCGHVLYSVARFRILNLGPSWPTDAWHSRPRKAVATPTSFSIAASRPKGARDERGARRLLSQKSASLLPGAWKRRARAAEGAAQGAKAPFGGFHGAA